MILLRLHVPGQAPKELGLDDPVIGIGRDPTNQVVIDDQMASRHHCQIEREGGHWKVVDNASANGTAINGQMSNFRRLSVGDRIGIGQTEIEIVDLTGGRASRRAPAMRDPDPDRAPRRERVRARGGSSQAAGWGIAAVCGLIAIGWIASNQVQDSFDRGVLGDARAQLRDQFYSQAIEQTQRISPRSRFYAEAKALESEIRKAREEVERTTLEIKAKAAFANLEEFPKNPNTTRADMQRYVNNFLRDYGESSYASRAQEVIDRVPEVGEDGKRPPPPEQPVGPKPKSTSKHGGIDEVLAQADRYVEKREFGSAIEVLTDFWVSERSGKDGEKANQRLTEVRAKAEKAWADIKTEVDLHLKASRPDKALEMLWEAQSYGIDSIVEAARKMSAEIESKSK